MKVSSVYEDGRRQPGKVPLGRAGEIARTTPGFVWIGLQQPSAEDLAVVGDEFGLPSLAVEDAVSAHQRPELEVYDGVVFVVLKPVRYVDHDEVVDVSEIAIFLGLNFCVRSGTATATCWGESGPSSTAASDGIGTAAFDRPRGMEDAPDVGPLLT